jgi:hypothetical protein
VDLAGNTVSPPPHEKPKRIGDLTLNTVNAVFCVTCKRQVDPVDVFCRACGADQRPPALRLDKTKSPTSPAAGATSAPSVKPVPNLLMIFVLWGTVSLDVIFRVGGLTLGAWTKNFTDLWAVFTVLALAFFGVSLTIAIRFVKSSVYAEKINGGIVITFHIVSFIAAIIFSIMIFSMKAGMTNHR